MHSNLKFFFIVYLFSCATLVAYNQTFTSSNLPLVVIDTNGQTIKYDPNIDIPKIPADMGIIWNGSGKRNTLNDPMSDYDGKIGIEIRGSSSTQFPKKSYGFETKSDDLIDIDVSLLGMPEENDWVLYAPYTDKTMIRDVLTYTFDASFGNYSPRCRYVELFLNENYLGVYVLMEKIKRNKNRVNIAKLTVTDISGENLTGGYIIKIDKKQGGDIEGWNSSYTSAAGKRTFYMYDYPKFKDLKAEQKTYIQDYVKTMETALYQGKYFGTGSYHDYLNDSSFIDFMIMNELARNIDGYRLSSYLYKGKNDKMNCGPLWDFNLTYGNADYYSGWLTEGFQYQLNLGNDSWQTPFWWNKLLQDPTYVLKLKKRWVTLRKKELSDQKITFTIDSLTNVIAEAQVRNYQKWPILGIKVWPNKFVGNTYSSEVDWLKDWITKRLAYLDKMWQYDFTGTGDQLVSQRVSIFPNPFTEQLSIQLVTGINGAAYVEWYNSHGSLVRKSATELINGQIRLGFSGNNFLSPGLYIIRIICNNRILLTEKVVKTL